MKRPQLIVTLAAALAVLAIVVAAFALGWLPAPGFLHLGVTAGTCQRDEEIDADTRAGLDSAAGAFVRTLLGDHPEATYPLLTDAAKKTMPVDKMGAGIRAFSKNAGFANLTAQHTFYLDDHGKGADGRTVCSLDGRAVSVSLRPGAEQGHVLMTAASRNNVWTIVLWLLKENGQWRVQYVHLGPSAMAGFTAEKLLAMSKTEHDGGHALNAAMLFTGAAFLMDRGTTYQMVGVQQYAGALRKTLTAPAEITGTSPFSWTMNGKTWKVSHVTITGIGRGDLGLVIDLPQADWLGNDDARVRNQEFLSAFVATHPDYARVFGFLVARAFKPDNTGGFSTIYQRGKGFL